MKSRLVFPIIITVMMMGVTPGLAQSPTNFYTLGIHMGFSSFWASKMAGEQYSEGNRNTYLSNAYASLRNAKSLMVVINSPYGANPILRSGDIDECVKTAEAIFNGTGDAEYYKGFSQMISNKINAARDSYTAQLASLPPNQSYLGQAYLMSVNIAIAEGQATVGDEARVIVVSALNNAKAALAEFVKQRPAIEVRPLDECILFASGTTPMTEVYSKILSLRTTYQSLIR